MATRSLCLVAPAKVNLGLRIVGRRPDGYHRLESLFAPLALCDELELALGTGPADRAVSFELVSQAPGPLAAPGDASNLAVRAAQAFADRAGLGSTIRVRLHKRIPAAAGLGGGSSDAAAVLRGLLELHPDALSQSELAQLALELGADVPFFLQLRPAWVRGIGERIEPTVGLPEFHLVLANPGLSLATARVYAAFDAASPALTHSGAGSTMPAVSGLRADPRALAALLHNDLEPAATQLCPAIAALRVRLESGGAIAVGMSGSGATVFGIHANEQAASAALAALALESPAWALSTRIEVGSASG